LQKSDDSQKNYEAEVEKLRNELSEYKLKKEAKLMKALANVNQGSNGSNNFS
jgi:hypothetical protein